MKAGSTTSPQNEISFKIAHAPFNNKTLADFVLHSDPSGVDFYVIRQYLALGSSFFQSLFTLDQTGVDHQEMRGGLPVVRLTEDAATLEAVFKYCYPRWLTESEAPSDNFRLLIKVYEAAVKYDMQGVEEAVRKQLKSDRLLSVGNTPLRIYALALSHDLEDEVKIAARASLRLPMDTYVEELEHITAGDYHRLFDYRRRCGESAERVVRDLSWVGEDTQIWFETCVGECRRQQQYQSQGVQVTISHNRKRTITARWWLDYMDQVSRTLKERPSSTVATDQELYQVALLSAATCRTCFQSRLFEEFSEFTKKLAKVVDITISKVRFIVCLQHLSPHVRIGPVGTCEEAVNASA